MMRRLAGAACLLLLAGSISAAGDPKAGRTKSEACLGCHGIPDYNNVYPTYHVPRLAGQHAEYIVAALKEYANDNRQHPTMTPQAQSLSEQDMADIAAFWEGLGKQ